MKVLYFLFIINYYYYIIGLLFFSFFFNFINVGGPYGRPLTKQNKQQQTRYKKPLDLYFKPNDELAKKTDNNKYKNDSSIG